MKFSQNLNINGNQAINLRAENIVSTSTSGNAAGRIIYDSGSLKWFDGTAWNTVGSASPTVSDATTSAKGIIELAGDLGGTAASPTLVATSNATLTTLSGITTLNSGGSIRVGTTVGIGTGQSSQLVLNLGGTLASASALGGINQGITFTLSTNNYAGYGALFANTLALPTSGTITGLAYTGLSLSSINNSGGTTTGSNTIANIYGINIAAQAAVSNATVTNAYGIYINSPTGGGTLNYSLYTNGTAPVYFGGALTVNGILSLGTTPVAVSNTAGNILTSALSGAIPATIFPALTGDVTNTAGSLATSLVATSNGTLYSFLPAQGMTFSPIFSGNNTNAVSVNPNIAASGVSPVFTAFSIFPTFTTAINNTTQSHLSIGNSNANISIGATTGNNIKNVVINSIGISASAGATITAFQSLYIPSQATITNATGPTSAYGIYVGAPSIGATNNYGIAVASAGGTVNWTVTGAGNTVQTGNATISGTITAGSGSNVITTAAGLLDATKLTGAASSLSSVTTTGDVTVGGNLNITGQVNDTTVNTLTVSDYDILTANTATTTTSTFTSPTYTSGALTTARSPGISVMRYSASAQRQDPAFVWNETAKRWVMSSIKSGAATTDVPSLLVVPLTYTVASTTANPMVVTHNLNALFPVVMVYDTSTGILDMPDVTITDANTVSLSFGTAPTTGQYTVVVLG